MRLAKSLTSLKSNLKTHVSRTRLNPNGSEDPISKGLQGSWFRVYQVVPGGGTIQNLSLEIEGLPTMKILEIEESENNSRKIQRTQ